VITDYQAQLERDWVEKLRKKYPVTIDEKVWTEVVKKAGLGRFGVCSPWFVVSG
jgi:hypothetical protein